MTRDTRTADDIEREIADQRQQMRGSIDELQKKFSLEAIANDIGAMVRDQGGEIGRAIAQTVGRNPAAVVVVGVGLAWLFLGQGRTRAGSGRRSEGTPPGRRADRAMSYGGAHPDTVGTQDRNWFGDSRTADPRPSAQAGTGGRALNQPANRPGAQDAANGLVGKVRGAAGAAADAVSHAASDASDWLSEGLEDLSDEAKNRVLSARRAAHDAREASERAMARGSRAASGFFDDQPLVTGALAMALGAAIGGLLPHSRLEDDSMGASSDQLFADAQSLFREERDRAVAALRMAAEDAGDEIASAGSDLAGLVTDGKNCADVIVGRASDAAGRIIDHATGQVEHDGPDRTRT
ncbi:MAG: DUF3618 domain-containing protein [Gemmobacter sp.]